MGGREAYLEKHKAALILALCRKAALFVLCSEMYLTLRRKAVFLSLLAPGCKAMVVSKRKI